MSYNPLYDPFAPLTAATTPSPHATSTAAAQSGGWLVHFIEHPGSPLPYEIGVVAIGGLLFTWAKLKGGDHQRVDPLRGFASRRELNQTISDKAIRRKVHVLRPTTYGEISRKDRRGLDPREGGLPLGRTVVGAKGVAVYAPIEHVTVIEAPPRIGKTAILAGVVIDAPGPCVVTSMRPDIVENTAPLRSRRGRLSNFDPESLSKFGSTVKIDLVSDCADPDMAIETAGYILAGTVGAEGVTNRNFWEGAAFEVLRSFLHAAALGGKNLMDVWRWAQGGSSDEAAYILRYNEGASEGWAGALEFTLKHGKDGQTRDSILKTLSLALGFMANPAVARTVTPAKGEAFDIDEFLNSRGDTLYMLGRDRPHSSTAPVFTAFLGRLVERGMRKSGHYEGGRLDPVLTIAADEACNIAPVPLERWTTSAGGSGICIVFVIQSKAQLEARYGQATADTIMNGATCKVMLGGTDDENRLRQVSTRCGHYWDWDQDHTANPQGGTSTHRKKVRREVMPPADIAMIPENRALVIFHYAKPTIVEFTPVWKRKDIKRAGKTVDVAALIDAHARRPEVPRQAPAPEPRYAAPAPVAGFQAFQAPAPAADTDSPQTAPQQPSDGPLRPRPVNPWENR
jgi:type IV secretory pathway TraG/TraD family ATPase VirD4